MKIGEIYKKYDIMPNLQLHLLRVAGVAKIICENFKKPLNKDLIINVCLLHDMGNVMKFDFNSKQFPNSWYAPKGKEYWKNVRRAFIKKYGEEAFMANYKIAKELELPKEGLKIIKFLGFKNMGKIYKSDDFNLKICEYSDMRAKPTYAK